MIGHLLDDHQWQAKEALLLDTGLALLTQPTTRTPDARLATTEGRGQSG
jgi:hypothetical protein